MLTRSVLGGIGPGSNLGFWTCCQQYSLGTCLHWDCTAMGDIVKISLCVPSTYVQNAILSLQIIHTIPSLQIYVATDNPPLVPSISCLTIISYLWNYVHAADNASHTAILQTNCCQGCSHFYQFSDGIQVTQVFRYCGERQG
jgi:hypothetical protein